MTEAATGNAVRIPTLADIEAAREVLRGVSVYTPMEESRWLSSIVGGPVLIKAENLQRTGSFKIRGAYVRMSRLSEEEKAAGVVAASAGNHAQGVALAAQMLGIKATVFMPEGAPIPKEKATRGYGADVRFHGVSIDQALLAARQFSDETGAVLIHPFDHVDIVTGQGTCGLEILEQCPEVKTVVVSTGGGGFIGGIATAVKSLRPDVRVVGVQAAGAAQHVLELADPGLGLRLLLARRVVAAVLLQVAFFAGGADTGDDLAPDGTAQVVELRLELVEGVLRQPDGVLFAAGLGHGEELLCLSGTGGCMRVAPVV
jgi:hypothetical protein